MRCELPEDECKFEALPNRPFAVHVAGPDAGLCEDCVHNTLRADRIARGKQLALAFRCIAAKYGLAGKRQD